MEIVKLGHNDMYTVKTAESCHTFFNEVIPHADMDNVELRAMGCVSGALYGDKATEFLKIWEIEK